MSNLLFLAFIITAFFIKIVLWLAPCFTYLYLSDAALGSTNIVAHIARSLASAKNVTAA